MISLASGVGTGLFVRAPFHPLSLKELKVYDTIKTREEDLAGWMLTWIHKCSLDRAPRYRQLAHWVSCWAISLCLLSPWVVQYLALLSAHLLTRYLYRPALHLFQLKRLAICLFRVASFASSHASVIKRSVLQSDIRFGICSPLPRQRRWSQLPALSHVSIKRNES